LQVFIPLPNNESLQGILDVPPVNPKSLIIFAHGSGSNISSPRNKYIANVLNGSGFATVLTDLLTPEEQDSDIKSQKIVGRFPGIVLNKFNIQLLSSRLTAITNWIIGNNELESSPGLEVKDILIGYFGASTGAAAAVEASISNPYSSRIYAIVLKGGRLDSVVLML
jgi:putative phosphoribosyl transferase